jgi:uncharacterized YigZ family protein
MKIISQPAVGEYEDKKSRFIASLAYVKTEEEALEFIQAKRKQYYDARHNVYAYVVREGNVSRYSDDGEPQGTGGVPVLDVINKAGLTDVCVVVTRYFGGILLGANGLVRAYSQACSLAISEADILNMYECSMISFSCDYNLYGKIKYILPDHEVITQREDFADTVDMELFVKTELCDAFLKKLTDISNGQLKYEIQEGLWADFSVNNR